MGLLGEVDAAVDDERARAEVRDRDRSGETPARRASVSIRAALAVSSKAATVAPAKTSVASAAHLLEGEKAPGDFAGDGGETPRSTAARH